jgi:hypothetical protein
MRLRDIDLMQLADNELDPAARGEVERAVAEAPDTAVLHDKLAALEELGELVRGDLELAADEVEPRLAGMWAEIEKRMDLDRAPAAAAPVPGPGLWGRFSRWVDAHRGHVLTGALSAGAVAAIALVMRPEPVQIETARTDAPAALPSQPEVDRDVTAVLQHTPVEVQSLEVSGGTSTVFTYQDEDGEQSTVIWVTPEDTVEGL